MDQAKHAEPGLLVLGIESSCDETAAAVVRRSGEGVPQILSSVILSQHEAHADFGGVVPEIAARAHVSHMDHVVARAMVAAGVDWRELDAVAATAGPGLIGGVIVGLMTAKAIALAHGLALVAVNHLEGHALSVRLGAEIEFPYLLLLVSGGHTQILICEGVGRYRPLGATIDDALGEAFDKTAKLLDLGLPGGPAVERRAEKGDGTRFDLPRPLIGREGCDFSFSGLKTALRKAAREAAPLSEKDIADLCAGFSEAAIDCVEDRMRHAIIRFRQACPAVSAPALVAAGGVAANSALRRRLAHLARETGFRLVVPAAELCTDNAAMIAWAGAERFARGHSDGLDFAPRARWALDAGAGAAQTGESAP